MTEHCPLRNNGSDFRILAEPTGRDIEFETRTRPCQSRSHGSEGLSLIATMFTQPLQRCLTRYTQPHRRLRQTAACEKQCHGSTIARTDEYGDWRAIQLRVRCQAIAKMCACRRRQSTCVTL